MAGLVPAIQFFPNLSSFQASARRHRGLDAARIDLAVQPRIELVAVELALPPGDDDAGDAIAGDVGERAAFAHELVDAEHDRHAGNQLRPYRGERGGERDKAGAGDTAGA